MLQISRKWFEMGLKVNNNSNNSGTHQGTTKESDQMEVNRQGVLVKWELIKLISTLFPLHLFGFLPRASEQHMINVKVLSWSLIYYCKTTVKYKVKGGKAHCYAEPAFVCVRVRKGICCDSEYFSRPKAGLPNRRFTMETRVFQMYHTLCLCVLDGNRISSLFKIKLLCSDATIWKPKHLSTYRKLHHEAYRQISMWAADTQHAPIGCWCIFFPASGNLVSPSKEGPVSVSTEDGVVAKPLSWVEMLLLGQLHL